MSVINSRTVRRIHRANAVLLGLFIAVHILVNLSAWGGARLHGEVRDVVRTVYQADAVEALLVLVVLLQVATGLRQVARRRRFDIVSASGVYLAFFMVIHMSAAIGTRRVIGLDTDYFWAAGSLAYGALGVGFTVYYALALISLCVHLGAAFRRGWPGRRASVLAGFALSVVLLLPFSPVLREAPIPSEVRAYYDQTFGWTGQVPG